MSRFMRAKLLWPTILSVIGLAILVGLGTWQLNRRTWKENLLATLKSRSAAPPLLATATWPGLPCHDLPPNGLPNPCEYQPLTVRGTFDHARERHIFTAAPQVPGLGSGRGFWIFTPLRLENNAKTVYVNRGFVREAQKDPATRAAGQTEGVVEVTGLYRSAQVRASFDNPNDPAKNFWYVRAPSELWADDADGSTGGTLNEMWAYIDQSAPEPQGGWPKPLAAKIEISNRHLEYALTWYGLALTLLGVYGAFAWGRLSAQASLVPSPRPD